MLSSKTPRSHVRLYAAAWTAAVAAIPAYIAAGTYILAGAHFVPERIPLTLLAILAAGISGYWIGWRMIDPNGERDSFGALFLGAAICLLSYYLLGVMVGALDIVPKLLAMFPLVTPSLLLNLLVGVLGALGSIFVVTPGFGLYFGILTTGWYTFPIAIVAGLVLSFAYRRR